MTKPQRAKQQAKEHRDHPQVTLRGSVAKLKYSAAIKGRLLGCEAFSPFLNRVHLPFIHSFEPFFDPDCALAFLGEL